MQDLSALTPLSSLIPTSQHAGNQTSENSALTAPGSASAAVTQGDIQPAPVLGAADKPRATLVPDGPRGGQPSPVPWTAADGSPWKTSADSEYLPRMQLKHGQWNEV